MVEITIVILVIMLVLLLLGFPIKVPLLMSALAVVVIFFPDVDARVMVQQWIGGIEPEALIAVPMFILAADIMTRGQAADRLLDAVMTCVGHLRGGMPITSAISCTAFGAISGSTQATVVAIGGPLRPRLLRAGYSDSFTSALIINASDIAMLIPPSIAMIVFGVVGNTSIGELFIAGIGPGLMILAMFCIYCWIASIWMKIPRAEKASPVNRVPLLVRLGVYTLVIVVPPLVRATGLAEMIQLLPFIGFLGDALALVGGMGLAETGVALLLAAGLLEAGVYRTVDVKAAAWRALAYGGLAGVVALVVGILISIIANVMEQRELLAEIPWQGLLRMVVAVSGAAAAIGVSVPWLAEFAQTRVGKSLIRALWPAGFPVIIIGGIYGGIFSPTEAAAVSVLYAIILEVFVFRGLTFRDMPSIALNSGLITAVVFVLVGAGTAFSWVIAFANLPEFLIGIDAESGYWTIMITIAVAYFIGCMFVDPIVVILILTPIFAPIAVAAGIDPVLVGVIVTMQVAIGSATPPFGVDIFTAIAIFRRPYFEVIRGTPPFIIILLVSVLLVMAFPQIALFLRDLAFH